jgi:hypothetical protein
MLGFLFLELGLEPVLQALEMDETDTSRALARYDARVLFSGFVAPAESATALGWLSRV